MADPLIGRKLNNYRIDRLLGRGGMASVYYGWDTNLERPVAVKIIEPEADPAFAKRLVQEARAIARWRHEHIIQVHHADTSDGLSYFAMEYIEGLDLAQIIHQYADEGLLMPHDDVLRMGWAIARALDYAHAHGVIHRDVKPSNVMVANDGRIVLMDFGLALNVQQGTMGEVFGTPHYIAPEQAVSSSNVTAQSDLYSLAVVLYEMLTGQPPYDDPSPISLALKHVSEPLPMPTSLNPELPIAAEAVLLKALSKSPDERFTSGADMMSLLENALAPTPAPLPERFTLSKVSIADRVALHMAATMEHDYPKDPAVPQTAGPRRTPPLRAGATTPHSPAAASRPPVGGILAGAGLLIGLVAIGVIILLVVLGRSMLSGSEATPTTAFAAGGSTSDAGVIDPAKGPTPEAPTPAPGDTAVPTDAIPTDIAPTVESAAPTPDPNGYRLVLLYTDTAFYLWNPGDQTINIREIKFESLKGNSDKPGKYSFEGKEWADFYEEVRPGHCDAIEIAQQAAYNRPGQCVGFSATRSPMGDSDQIFWVAQEGSTQFRVTWHKKEIARCEISAGICEIYLPPD